ncbi:MAG: hypothetical protein OXI24_05410, partial [Candidatus Poribacteria bacterium]|nr:hypothetical protein [Candidatus Poribacteria bacterium]
VMLSVLVLGVACSQEPLTPEQEIEQEYETLVDRNSELDRKKSYISQETFCQESIAWHEDLFALDIRAFDLGITVYESQEDMEQMHAHLRARFLISPCADMYRQHTAEQ